MPKMAAMAEPCAVESVHSPNQVTDAICESQLIWYS
jgi:hypothetical protein